MSNVIIFPKSFISTTAVKYSILYSLMVFMISWTCHVRNIGSNSLNLVQEVITNSSIVLDNTIIKMIQSISLQSIVTGSIAPMSIFPVVK